MAFRFLLIKAHGLDGDRSELINSLCVGHVGEQVTLNTVFLHIYGLVCLFLAMSLACRLLRSLRSADATLACLDCLLVAHSHLIKHGYDNATIDWPRSRIAVEVQACRQGLPQAYVLLVVGAEDVVCCLLILRYSRRQCAVRNVRCGSLVRWISRKSIDESELLRALHHTIGSFLVQRDFLFGSRWSLNDHVTATVG